MKRLILHLLTALTCILTHAQIGYQVSLLNTATGEPRANESVQVSVSITDSQGTTVYNGTQSALTNDFGILSLTVGDAATFDNVDWAKLPLYISATVDGILIGRSQILNVPVAEYAKRTGSLTKDILCSRSWESTRHGSFHFNKDGTGTQINGSWIAAFDYVIEGSIVFIVVNNKDTVYGIYLPSKGTIVFEF